MDVDGWNEHANVTVKYISSILIPMQKYRWYARKMPTAVSRDVWSTVK